MNRRRHDTFALVRAQRGVSLIELMVGVVVALLATLVITQTLVFAEAQKRTTTSGSDAQVNGALALYSLQRDLQSAGYGLTISRTALGCEIRAQYNGTNFTWTLAPVVITAGTNGAPDSVQVLGSDKDSYSIVAPIITNHPRTAANFFVSSALGIADGDMMLAVPETPDAANWCSVFQVTNSNAGPGDGLGNNKVNHNSGLSNWNQPTNSVFPTDGYQVGSYLVNLGRFTSRTYSVSARQRLQQADFSTTNGTTSTRDVFNNIVQLRAFYGKDTSGDGIVDSYDNTTPTTQAGWAQVLTVRVAIVARSAQYERDVVTSSNPLWNVGAAVPVAGAATCGSSECVTLKIDTLTDWQHYRYKVYETTVPLRNMLWHS
ncbi:PilW family protein [Caldimonas sp. KR1-144]|uniref:PilW family protein n=1 Tax=Caldimonas sp. KR1-144 TaxID=3400911 RepID=UPI003BFF2046